MPAEKLIVSTSDGMFAILVPATLLPLIVTLFWAERKAKQLGIVDEPDIDDDESIRSRSSFPSVPIVCD